MTAKETKRDTTSNPVAAAVGKKLLALRLEAGLNQEEFAAKIGVRQAMVSRYEAGHEAPRLETLFRIADGAGKNKAEAVEIMASFIEVAGRELRKIDAAAGPKPVASAKDRARMDKAKPDRKAVKVARKTAAKDKALDLITDKPKRQHRRTRPVATVTASVASETAPDPTPAEA
jgi:transcriptional regulator with XRE-family HTH domain